MSDRTESPDISRKSALREAAEVVEHRRASYGGPRENFERIAALWTVALAGKLRPDQRVGLTDVAQLMRLVKEARLIETPDHRDSLVDICGYVDCHEQVIRPVGYGAEAV